MYNYIPEWQPDSDRGKYHDNCQGLFRLGNCYDGHNLPAKWNVIEPDLVRPHYFARFHNNSQRCDESYLKLPVWVWECFCIHLGQRKVTSKLGKKLPAHY